MGSGLRGNRIPDDGPWVTVEPRLQLWVPVEMRDRVSEQGGGRTVNTAQSVERGSEVASRGALMPSIVPSSVWTSAPDASTFGAPATRHD